MTVRKIRVLVIVSVAACMLTILYFILSAHTMNLQAVLPKISGTTALYTQWFKQEYWSSQRNTLDSAALAKCVQEIADSLRSGDAFLDHLGMVRLDRGEVLTKKLDALAEALRKQELTFRKESMMSILKDLGELGHEYAFTAWSSEKDIGNHLAESFKENAMAMSARRVPQVAALKDLVDRLTWYSLWLEEPELYLLSLKKEPNWAGEYSATVMKEVLNTAQEFSKLLISFLCDQSSVRQWIRTYKMAIPLVGNGKQPPKDLEGNGFYQDVNGNGKLDAADVVALKQGLASPVVQYHVGAFDYNGDGVVDSKDVDWLAEKIGQSS
ncbi:MAG: dockerin type I repeat-containing protein [Candidatus Latescibacteria bacterium]|nr:dockerin type I repeat-containing protein [Candidatus Latescibacterota bacterium]